MVKKANCCTKIGVWFIGIVLFYGCGGTPLKVTPVDKTANPTEIIAQLGKDIERARADQVDILSPTWFEKAVQSHAQAKKGLEQGAELAGILKNIAQGRAELQQADVITVRSRDLLADTIKSREAARAVNAQQFKDEYKATESNFLSLTRAIEDGELSTAQEKSKAVGQEFRSLELRAISLSSVGDIRRMKVQAKDDRVPKAAPKAFAEAQQTLADAEAFIAGNRYDQAGVQQHAAQAQFMMQRAKVIADEARKLTEMAPEDIALKTESLLSQITTTLHAKDQRNAPFEQQQEAILSSIASLQSSQTQALKRIEEKDELVQKLTDRLGELEGVSQKVKYDKDRLAAEKRFNEQFVVVQGYFHPREAEVYKQYDTLVIRLKGMQFPVGQSVVQPASYPLLTKVQRAIKTFGQPDVVIEGHTDSTGSEQNNLALSTARAESVEQYLVANGTLSKTKIKAVGHGPSRPIAPNETAEGRAQNRRIDVIIKPHMKDMK
ncbi:MAG: OmpA family protein [Desulfatitalea sp.]|nr:OmpA family protein [Desulfatitalea sp.]NNJ99502.1 OmpA family protein [Desulfatitalea sp.]